MLYGDLMGWMGGGGGREVQGEGKEKNMHTYS